MPHAQRLTLLAAMLAFALPGSAIAQTLTVNNIVATGAGGLRIEIPAITTEDANLDEAAIRAMFSGDTYTGLISGLAGLDAARVSIPEVIVSYDLPADEGQTGRAEITYFDLELNDVAEGHAAGASLATIEIKGANETVVTIGTMAVDRLDLGGIFASYGLGAARDDRTMKPLYENFRLHGASVSSPDFTCEVGPAATERLSARPIEGNFADLLALVSELDGAEAGGTRPTSETISNLIAYYADVLTAFESTPTTLDGLSCFGTEDGKHIRLGASGMTVGGFSPGIYPAFSIDGFRLDVADEGWFEFDNFTWKAMDLRHPISVLLEARDNLSEQWFEENWRSIVPAIEGFSISGLALDVPQEESPDDRVKLSVGSMDMTLSDYANGIPATIAASASSIVFDLPETGEGSELRHLGYERLDLGYNLAARWDEPAREIVIDALTFTSAGMGTFTLAGVVGNAGAELFSSNQRVAEAAAAALTIKQLDIEINNGGLAAGLIALIAREENQEPEVFHLALAGLARALPLGILGGTPEAIGLSNALGDFLGGAPNLKISLNSVAPAGLGMAELMAAEDDPTVLKGKVTITAEATGEPVPFVWPDLPEPEAPPPPPAPGPNPRPPATSGS